MEYTREEKIERLKNNIYKLKTSIDLKTRLVNQMQTGTRVNSKDYFEIKEEINEDKLNLQAYSLLLQKIEKGEVK